MDPIDATYPELLPSWQLIAMLISLGSICYSLFWLWMLVDCIRNEPDRLFWGCVLLFIPFPGAILYAVLREPTSARGAPPFLNVWSRRKELQRLEAAALQIGNPHQYVQWGDALREVGRTKEAAEAYQKALEKEPKNLMALWGLAQTAKTQGQWAQALDWTRRILALDPAYKFGDVSLLTGQALLELGQTDEAFAHFQEHARRWRHPESLYLLAKLQKERGDEAAARETLVGLLRDINGSPSAIARKFGRWKSRGQQLLRQLKA